MLNFFCPQNQKVVPKKFQNFFLWFEKPPNELKAVQSGLTLRSFKCENRFDFEIQSFGLFLKMKEITEQPSRWKRAEDIIQEYAEYSTIAGVIYIYMKDQTWFGKLYWKIWILLLFVLGTYWSCQVIY